MIEPLVLTFPVAEGYLDDLRRLYEQLRGGPIELCPDQVRAAYACKEQYTVGLFASPPDADRRRLIGVGTIFFPPEVTGSFGFIRGVVVDERFRGHGFFGVILDNLKAQARSRGVPWSDLICTNPETGQRYEKHGFARRENAGVHRFDVK